MNHPLVPSFGNCTCTCNENWGGGSPIPNGERLLLLPEIMDSSSKLYQGFTKVPNYAKCLTTALRHCLCLTTNVLLGVATDANGKRNRGLNQMLRIVFFFRSSNPLPLALVGTETPIADWLQSDTVPS